MPGGRSSVGPRGSSKRSGSPYRSGVPQGSFPFTEQPAALGIEAAQDLACRLRGARACAGLALERLNRDTLLGSC